RPERRARRRRPLRPGADALLVRARRRAQAPGPPRGLRPRARLGGAGARLPALPRPRAAQPLRPPPPARVARRDRAGSAGAGRLISVRRVGARGVTAPARAPAAPA